MNERWLEILLTPLRDGITVAETCRRYGVSRQSFYDYRRRLHDEGVAALQPRSRRPHSSPVRTAPEIEERIVTMRTDNPRWGARTIHTRLIRAGLAAPPAVSTIHRILQRHGMVTAPIRRAPRTWRRFERFAPNDLWQIDGTQVELVDASKAWVVDLLDDHARYAIGATATRRFTGYAAWTAMETAIDENGAPRQLISDNGMQFKSGEGEKPVFFQERLKAMGITQLSSRPRHPQTCGKLERYHRTFKEFYADHGPAVDIQDLQRICDEFRWYYNNDRPHRALDEQTPSQVYETLPKVVPGDPRPKRRNHGPRTLKVSKAGSFNYRKRKINIGQAYTGQHVTVTEVGDLVLVTHTASQKLLRELTLGPVGSYHPSGNKRGRPRKTASATPELVVSAMS
ncbi:IS481 family transposase [Antrihabitans stalactiti]|uniref:IS481 family transposase n=1 Tax=Antrihabitans stalactiti TaxID=2584121 RepID=UPI00146F263F